LAWQLAGGDLVLGLGEQLSGQETAAQGQLPDLETLPLISLHW
jgi:hypothetical protein